MADDLAWVSTVVKQPQDRERVYARVKDGQPKKVTFYTNPVPRWEGASIVYDFQYFAEWASLGGERRPPKRTK